MLVFMRFCRPSWQAPEVGTPMGAMDCKLNSGHHLLSPVKLVAIINTGSAQGCPVIVRGTLIMPSRSQIPPNACLSICNRVSTSMPSSCLSTQVGTPALTGNALVQSSDILHPAPINNGALQPADAVLAALPETDASSGESADLVVAKLRLLEA